MCRTAPARPVRPSSTLLQVAGAKHIIAVDEHGILVPGRPAGLEGHKAKLAEETNPEKMQRQPGRRPLRAPICSLVRPLQVR